MRIVVVVVVYFSARRRKEAGVVGQRANLDSSNVISDSDSGHRLERPVSVTPSSRNARCSNIVKDDVPTLFPLERCIPEQPSLIGPNPVCIPDRIASNNPPPAPPPIRQPLYTPPSSHAARPWQCEYPRHANRHTTKRTKRDVMSNHKTLTRPDRKHPSRPVGGRHNGW